MDIKRKSLNCYVNKDKFIIDKDITTKLLDINKKDNEIHITLKKILNDYNEFFNIITLILNYENWNKDDYEKYINLNNELSLLGKSIKDIKRKQLINKNIGELVSKYRIPKYNTLNSFCKGFDFNDETLDSKNCKLYNIPLTDTIPLNSKQYVIGRQRNILSYYECKDDFYTLNSKYWDIEYILNDMFINCILDSVSNTSILLPNKFLIRIVLSSNLFSEKDDRLITIKETEKQYTVTNREICQFILTGMFDIYQSREYKYIFFLSIKDIKHDDTRFIKINDKNSDIISYLS